MKVFSLNKVKMKNVRQTENGVERGFLKHWQNLFKLTNPYVFRTALTKPSE